MADGRRIVWQSYRPAAAAAGTKPSCYCLTLAAAPDAAGLSVYNLSAIGLQARTRHGLLTLLAGEAVLTLPGHPAEPLTPGLATVVPARGDGEAALLTLSSEMCSLRVVPGWVTASDRGLREGDPGDPVDPPPPFPGGSDGD